MSRKWERMVERNSKTVNKQRKKQGKPSIGSSSSEQMTAYKGRSWVLPLFLIGFAVFFSIAFNGVYPQDSTFWLTIGSYVFLGALIFLTRRPILRIGRTQLSSRRFTGDRTVEPADIEEISLEPGYVIIQLKRPRRSRWIFSRLLHRFPTNEVSARLKEFAEANHVVVKESSGKK